MKTEWTMEKKKVTKATINKLFLEIEFRRFENLKQIEDWFKYKIDDYAKNICIAECDGINSEVENGIHDLDYSTDCTFGENIFGFEYADFTLNYIKDNGGRIVITSADWN